MQHVNFMFSSDEQDMQVITSVCLILLLAIRSISGHAINQSNHHTENRMEAQSRGLDMESIFAGFAKSMISRTAGATSSQVPTDNNIIGVLFKICNYRYKKKKIVFNFY